MVARKAPSPGVRGGAVMPAVRERVPADGADWAGRCETGRRAPAGRSPVKPAASAARRLAAPFGARASCSTPRSSGASSPPGGSGGATPALCRRTASILKAGVLARSQGGARLALSGRQHADESTQART
eukprot:4251129-Prymnesium_polylepis.1